MIGWVKHNFWYKVLALCLSAALWVYVVNTYNPLTTLDVRAPVEIQNVPDGLQRTKLSPSEMRLRLRGRARALEPLKDGDTRVTLVASVAGKPAGSHDVALAARNLPLGVEVIESPALRATVELEEVTSRKRKVFVDREGLAAEGCRERVEAAQPETVEIRGPRSAVDSVRTVVARIDISDLAATTDFKPTVQPVSAEGQRVQGVTVQPARVDVRVIIERVPQRSVIVQPVFGDPPAGYQIERFSVQPTTVVVSGPSDLLNGLSSIRTVTISLTGVTERTTRSVRLAPPPKISVRGRAAATVTVYLKPFSRATLPEEEAPGAAEASPDEGAGHDEEAAGEEERAGDETGSD